MADDDTERQDAASLHWPHDTGREAQLRIAREMKNAGHVQQALHALNRLMDTYPQDAESRAAAVELASLAKECEQRGLVYTALHLYRQLEQLG